MPKTMNALHMSNTRAYEVQRTNNFEVQIVDVGGDDLTFAVTSSGLPNESNDAIELAYGNTKVKVAGAYTVDDITIEVRDFIGADIESIVRNWRRQVFNENTGGVGFADQYKKRGYIYLYSPEGSITRTWELEGIWPQSVTWGDLAYDGSDQRRISMNLAVDWATIR